MFCLFLIFLGNILFSDFNRIDIKLALGKSMKGLYY